MSQTSLISPADVKQLKQEIHSDWELSSGGKALIRSLKFPNFKQAFAFTTQVALLAEEKGHHPDLSLGWGYVRVSLTTHDCGGLTEKDFQLAAEMDLF